MSRVAAVVNIGHAIEKGSGNHHAGRIGRIGECTVFPFFHKFDSTSGVANTGDAVKQEQVKHPGCQFFDVGKVNV